MTPQATTIGILYPGELGTALAKLLAADGHRLVTTLVGRSARTEHRCRDVPFVVLPTVRDVACAAPILFSVVPPTAAVAVAEAVAAAMRDAGPRPTYVDVNSIAPQTVRHIARLLEPHGIDVVDASVHGLAGRLQAQGTLYLSGRRAAEIGQLFAPLMRVQLLGDAPGAASLAKMLLGGVSKGLVALLIEVSLTARAAGVLEPFLSELRHYYPGVIEIFERLLPTVPCHAARRAGEMAELVQTVTALGLDPAVVADVQQLYHRLGTADMDHRPLPAQASLSGWLEWIAAGVERNVSTDSQQTLDPLEKGISAIDRLSS
jgi:3-hydroxyisobutyrate dehydrogenase-like beta-hydroxyacid dehydrogenase